MANPSASTVKRAVGRLCTGPTDLGVAYPHGGTALGYVTDVRIVTRTREFVIRAEEYGLDATEVINLGTDFHVVCMVRGYDKALLDLFPWTVADGGSTGEPRIAVPGDAPGSLLTGNAVSLCFAPMGDDRPGFIVYRAIPNLERSTRIPFGVDDRWGFVAVFRGVRDGSGRVAQIGMLGDMSV